MWRRKAKEQRARKRDVMIETESQRCHAAGFKNREMAQPTKKCGWPPEAPGSKEMDSLLEPI